MTRASSVLLLGLLLTLLPTGLGGGSRVESQEYVLSGSGSCDDAPGVCFALTGAEEGFTVRVDDATGLPMTHIVAYRIDGEWLVANIPSCGSELRGIPEGADVVAVRLGPWFAWDVIGWCGGQVPTVATVGTVTVTFVERA